MTHEGQGPRPDETLVPPTSTRWSGPESGTVEDGLVAPFLPGQSRRARAEEVPLAPAGSQPFEGGAPGTPPPVEPAAALPEPEAEGAEGGAATVEPEPADVVEEAFPFETPWSDEPAAERAGPAEEPEEWAAAAGSDGWSVSDEGAGPDEWVVADEGDETGGWSTPEDAFPVEAFEIEPETERPRSEEDREPAVGRRSAEEEVAATLERLASRLRSEGADGVERELASSDRLTSLLAAVLAGHLTSR